MKANLHEMLLEEKKTKHESLLEEINAVLYPPNYPVNKSLDVYTYISEPPKLYLHPFEADETPFQTTDISDYEMSIRKNYLEWISND